MGSGVRHGLDSHRDKREGQGKFVDQENVIEDQRHAIANFGSDNENIIELIQ